MKSQIYHCPELLLTVCIFQCRTQGGGGVGGLGARAPRRGCECPKNFFAHYMILRVYTVMHTR